MRHADHAPARPETEPARPSPSGTRPSPVVAFGAALALALVGWGLFWLSSRGDPPADPGAGGGPGPSEGILLTDAEAIERIEQLSAEADLGIKTRNPALISRTHTSTSPLAEETFKDIRRLKRDQVLEKSTIRNLDWEVVSNTGDEIRIRESKVVRFCFKSETGKDVSRGPAAIQQTGIWILRWESDEWLIHDAFGEHESVVDKSHARCG